MVSSFIGGGNRSIREKTTVLFCSKFYHIMLYGEHCHEQEIVQECCNTPQTICCWLWCKRNNSFKCYTADEVESRLLQTWLFQSWYKTGNGINVVKCIW